MKNIKEKLIIHLILLILWNTSLKSQCVVPVYGPEIFENVEVRARYINGQIEKIANVFPGETKELKLVTNQNVIYGSSLEISDLIFATGCRIISVSTLNNLCDKGSICSETWECQNDSHVWTLPLKNDAVCNNIDFTFRTFYSQDIKINVSYITVIEFSCTEITEPLNNSDNIGRNSMIKWNYIPEAKAYKVSVGTTPNGAELLNRFNVGNINFYTLTNLDFNKKYYVSVFPVYDLIELYNCPVISFTTEGDCSFCCSYPTNYNDCVGFEEFSNGSFIPQANARFTLYNSSSASPQLVSNIGANGQKSIKFVNQTNIDYNISRTITESIPTRLEWAMFLPNGKSGTWGLETNNVDIYPIQVKLSNGDARIYNTTNNITTLKTTIKYNQNKWIKFTLIFQPAENEIELWLDGKFIYKITDYGSNKITDLNFAGDPNLGTNEFYIDNICYLEFLPFINCSSEFEPVCANNKEFENGCYAFFSGYSPCEVTNEKCGTVAVDDEDNIDDVTFITVVPNPTSGIINIDLDPQINAQKVQFSLHDIFGARQDYVKLQPGPVNLESLKAGIYFLQTRYQDRLQTKKIVLLN